MKKVLLTKVLACMVFTCAYADESDNMYLNLTADKAVKVPISNVESVTFYGTGENAIFTDIEKLAELTTSIQSAVGNVTQKSYSFSDFTQGYGWKCANKKVGATVTNTALSNYYNMEVPVSQGDYIIVSTAGADACRAYYLVDAENKVLELPGVYDGATLATFTINVTDATATKLLVNCNSSYTATENVKIQIYSGVSGLLSMALAGGSTSSTEVGSISGLKFLDFGDSVAAGAKSNKVTYVDMVAALTGGTVLASPAHAGDNIAEIRAQVDNAKSKKYTPDVVFLEGGLNDMCGTNEESGGTDFYTTETFETQGIGLGEFSPYDYTVPDGTGTSLTAQVEYIMYTVKKNYQNAIPMWVLTHRTAKRDAELQEKIYNRIIECARKWNVVVIDIFHNGALNGELYDLHPSMTDGTSSTNVGGTHPTTNGYQKFYVPMIMDALNKYAKKYY